MAFEFRHYKQIIEEWLSYVIGHSDITDINPGSVTRTIGEATALELAQIYIQIQTLLNLFSIDKASGEDLDERALDYGLERLQPERSVGVVTIGDSNLDSGDVAVSTLAASLTNGVSTQAQIQVADYASFPATGTLIIDRGDEGLRESIAWTSKTGPDLLNLDTTPVNDHDSGVTVYMSTVGSDRTIPLGSVLKTPQPNELKFETTEEAILYDGDYQVTNVAVQSQDTGTEMNVSAGKITVFDSPPFPTATVTNDDTFKGAIDLETDEAFRARIKDTQQSLSSSTVARIESEALKVQIEETGQRVITAKVLEPINPGESTLYINDGTSSYSPTTEAVEETEVILSVAEAGQLRASLDNWPIVDNSERIFVSLDRGVATDADATSLTDDTQSWTPSAAATGSVTTPAGASLVDGETFTLIDAMGTTKIFEFNSSGGVTAGHVAVPFTGGDTQATVRAAIVTAINNADIRITASNGAGGLVNLTQDDANSNGNTTISETVANGGFTKVNFSGGAGYGGFKVKDENNIIWSIESNTDTVLTLTAIGTTVPNIGAYAIFNPSSITYPTGSLLVKNTDYIINNTNGQFELDDAVFTTGLEQYDCLLAYYDGTTSAYTYYDGLLQKVQHVINGDPEDIDTYPGVKAAGTIVNVVSPNVVSITVTSAMSAKPGFDEITLRDLVKSAIVDYINNLTIGEDVVKSKIIEVAMSVTGVQDFQLITPTGNTVITDSQLAKTTLSAISVT